MSRILFYGFGGPPAGPSPTPVDMLTPAPHVPAGGLYALRHARNGVYPDAQKMAQLASYLNMLAGRRMKIHFRRFIQPTDALNATGTTTTWRTRFFTSPNVKEVRVRMLMIPAEETAVSDPYYKWTVGGVAQAEKHVTRLVAAATTITPGHYWVEDQVFKTGAGADLAGATHYEAELAVTDRARPIGATIYEVIRPILDTSVHLAVPPDAFLLGGDILDRDVTDLVSTGYTLYKHQGTPYVAWSVHGQSGVTQTGATFKNVLDSSTTGWSATAAGFQAWGYRRNTLVSSSVPVMLWAYGNVNTGTSGQARFSDDNGTIGTVAINSTAAGFFTQTATFNGTTPTTARNVIVEIRDTAGNIVSCSAAGMYHYLA